jgi:hypothetical protein
VKIARATTPLPFPLLWLPTLLGGHALLMNSGNEPISSADATPFYVDSQANMG